MSLKINFDRRSYRTNIEFPFIDSNGYEVFKERRSSIEDHLKNIQLEEIRITKQEFANLFRQ